MKTREAVVDVQRKTLDSPRETARKGPRRQESARVMEVVDRADGRTATLEPLPPARSVQKRAFELVVSLAMAVALMPLMALVVVLVRLDSPGPIFFRSRRVGYRGQPLEMVKFRKMHDDATGVQLTTHGDERFTRAGRWLARMKLDELPQLWHVVRGDMSLIGPRPESPDFVGHHPHEYQDITRVKPGIMGLSQLAFAGESAILDPNDPESHYVGGILPQKVALDRMYAERWSFWLDVRIALWTVVAIVFRRDVAVDRATAQMSLRKR
jgi:lipopolysaccharide/colanic/teichoic acid biosynthesis glycosyltransferase